jgi:hypothetical protein
MARQGEARLGWRGSVRFNFKTKRKTAVVKKSIREHAQREAVKTERLLLRHYASQPAHVKDRPDGSFAMSMWLLGYTSGRRSIVSERPEQGSNRSRMVRVAKDK